MTAPVSAAKIPLIISRTFTQLAAEKDCARSPDRAIAYVSGIDNLVCGLVDVGIRVGLDHSTLSLRYAPDRSRIVGAGRHLSGVHLLWWTSDVLDAAPDQAQRMTRICRNAAISSGSVDALFFLAEAVDAQHLDDLEPRLAALRSFATNG